MNEGDGNGKVALVAVRGEERGRDQRTPAGRFAKFGARILGHFPFIYVPYGQEELFYLRTIGRAQYLA